MAEREKPRPQEIYRHFKDEGMLYQIVTIAENTETGEEMVVYQALYGDFKMYVRPLEMFMSKVDKEKYPNADCDNRFEKVELRTAEKEIEVKLQDMEGTSYTGENEKAVYDVDAGIADEDTPQKELMSFLDADTYEEKRNILIHMRPRMTDRLIDDIAASMDITVESGDIDTRFASLLKCVRTLSKFEISR